YIYDGKKDFQEALMQSIYHDRPVNLIYFAKAENSEYDYELLDGQQRIITICKFIVNREFSVSIGDGQTQYWHGLDKEDRERILDYQLHVHVCEGNANELMRWFQTINTGAKELSNQELRNSIYNGPWVTDAKRYFTKKGGQTVMCGRYMSGKRERQDHLERILIWRTGSNQDSTIRQYMAKHRHERSAKHLWDYFKGIYEWIEDTFNVSKNAKNYRTKMKSVDWGSLYCEFKDKDFDPIEVAEKVTNLFKCDPKEVNQAGIYPFVLSGDEKYLNRRAFTAEERQSAYDRQEGVCAITNKELSIEEMEADHIKPWSEGGKTDADNCQMICKAAHHKKTAEQIRSLWASSKR
ncbi:MAG: HNH endonuclease, partial [Bacteroidetes bacterium]|nr:HNH endonuclease [Bacteroidota bacterium]